MTKKSWKRRSPPLTRYRITQYKLYTLDYMVEATGKLNALRQFAVDDNVPHDIVIDLDSLTFVENAESYGISVELVGLTDDEIRQDLPFQSHDGDYLETIADIKEEVTP